MALEQRKTPYEISQHYLKTKNFSFVYQNLYQLYISSIIIIKQKVVLLH